VRLCSGDFSWHSGRYADRAGRQAIIDASETETYPHELIPFAKRRFDDLIDRFAASLFDSRDRAGTPAESHCGGDDNPRPRQQPVAASSGDSNGNWPSCGYSSTSPVARTGLARERGAEGHMAEFDRNIEPPLFAEEQGLSRSRSRMGGAASSRSVAQIEAEKSKCAGKG
jgi:hypothetical protein